MSPFQVLRCFIGWEKDNHELELFPLKHPVYLRQLLSKQQEQQQTMGCDPNVMNLVLSVNFIPYLLLHSFLCSACLSVEHFSPHREHRTMVPS